MEYLPVPDDPTAALIREATKTWTFSRLEIKIKYKAVFLTPAPLNSPDPLFQYCLKIWDMDTIEIQEDLVAIFFNQGMRLIGHRKISRGDSVSAITFIQLIGAIALTSLATGVILVHNHPSKSLNPSTADLNITSKVSKALALYNIKLIDHLIISKIGYYSIAENNPAILSRCHGSH